MKYKIDFEFPEGTPWNITREVFDNAVLEAAGDVGAEIMTQTRVSDFEFDGGLYNTSMFLVINKEKWDSLSEEDQEAINSVSGEELAKLAGKAWDEADKTGISMSKKNDIEILKLSKNEKEITRKLLLPIINETLNKIKIKKNIDALKIYSMLIREIEILENK